jgi:hypothetical protein
MDGPFKGLVVRGAKRGCFAIGAVKQGISGSDTGIRRRFFVQHDLDKHVEGFSPNSRPFTRRATLPPGLAKGSWPRNRDWQQLVAYRTGRPDPSFLLQSNGKTHMTDIIPTAAEAKDLADDCCEALAELLSRPTTTARRPITQQILAEMQKTLSDESWAEAIGSPIKTYLGFNSIHLCMRLLRSHGHLAQAARIEAALEAAAGRLSEDKDDDVDPTIN